MFTNKKAKYYGDNKVLLDSACLSSDTKPTTGVANGSKCIEMDTGKTYMFNEEDSEWEELPSSGGGGGSSDFSTATVTFEGEASAAMPLIITTESGSSVDAILVTQRPFGNASYPIALYKGNAIILVTAFEEGEVITISGGGESLGDDMYLITGDCTITIS